MTQAMTIQSENKILKVFKNWGMGNILTIVGMFAGAFIYVDTRYGNIMAALAKHDTQNAVVESRLHNLDVDVQDVKSHLLIIDNKLDNHELLIDRLLTQNK